MLLDTGTVVSNHTQGTDVCPRTLCVVLSCESAEALRRTDHSFKESYARRMRKRSAGAVELQGNKVK